MKRAGWGLFSLFTCHSEGIARRICCSAAATKSRSFALLRMTARGSAVGHRAIGFAALLFALLPTLAHAADPVLRLDHAEFILSDAPEPPPDSADWKPQTLPDDWSLSRPNTSGYGWYRLRFSLPDQPHEPFAAYLPRIRTVGAIYINGVYAGRTGPFDKIESVGSAQLFAVPPSLLRAGPNTLHFRLLKTEGRAGLLTTVRLGDDTLVRPEYERRLFLERTIAQFNCAFSAVLGLFILLLWMRRPQESMYGYFGVTALLRALDVSGVFVHDPPLPQLYWDTMLSTIDQWLAVSTTLFALRYAGKHWPTVEKCLWAWALISIGMAYLGEVQSDMPLVGYWGYTHYFLVLVYLSILIIGVSKRGKLESSLVILTAVFYGASMLRDLFTNDGAEGLNWFPYRGFPLYVVIGWMLVDRFVKSLNESEKLNAELEQRVAQKHAALQETYQRMQQVERQAAIVEERSRIMSDMHDGMGGQLISTLSLVEHGEASSAEVAAALRECIDDLRITIDSLEPTENDLLPVLGNLRYRLDGRLKKQGIALDWQVSDVPKLACLTPQNVLHILRILQEAFTNVLKHAHASMISVETGMDGSNRVFIRVHDNGMGFEGDHKGHGLANMRRRAKIIGGELDIWPSPSGTTLNLLLPVT